MVARPASPFVERRFPRDFAQAARSDKRRRAVIFQRKKRVRLWMARSHTLDWGSIRRLVMVGRRWQVAGRTKLTESTLKHVLVENFFWQPCGVGIVPPRTEGQPF